MADIRIGLIGYGWWTRNAYLPALRRDGRAVVTAVAVPSSASRRRASDELGTDVAVVADVDSLVGGRVAELDAVMVAVADSAHESALSAVLESGLPVLYEPPVSCLRQRIRPMLNRLLEAQQVTHADLELAYIPAVQRVAGLVRARAVGETQFAEIRLEGNWGPVPDYDLCNTHHLVTWYADVLNEILGSRPSRVLVLEGHDTRGRRQSRNAAWLDYPGVWAGIRTNIASVGKISITVEVNGTDGEIRADLFTGEVSYRSRSTPQWATESCPALRPYADWPGMHESISDFMDAVESGKPTRGSARQVADLHMIGLAADESHDTGVWADIATL